MKQTKTHITFDALICAKKQLIALENSDAYWENEVKFREQCNDFMNNADFAKLNADELRTLCQLESSHRFMPLHSFLAKIGIDNF
jgi:sugar/nucleoside kinase (ribokinase family)